MDEAFAGVEGVSRRTPGFETVVVFTLDGPKDEG